MIVFLLVLPQNKMFKFKVSAYLSFCLIVLNASKLFKTTAGQPTPSPKNDIFKLPTNYSKEHRPSTNGETTVVTVTVHVQAINPIKAVDMDFRMDMTLTQRWNDPRLTFSEYWFDKKDYIILPQEFIDQIWHPHPFVVNAKSTDVGQLTQKLISVYIFRNQTIQYSINIFTTVACAMNYRYYPMDSQLCPMFLESFSFDETQVKFKWADGEPFTINPNLRMLQFEPRRPLHYSNASVPRYNEAKNFSQLIAYFRFDRLLGNHLIQTFAPCSLVVCLSWFSFWLELNALSARMSLVVTSILTLVTQFVGLKADLPPVAYVKCVDIWMAGCMVWVFGALGEFVLAKVVYSLTEDAKFIYHEDRLRIFQPVRYEFPSPVKQEVLAGDRKDQEDSNGNERLPPNPEEISNIPNGNTAERQQSLRQRKATSAEQKDEKVETGSIATTSSATLNGGFGRMRIPLQWTNERTGELVLLWRRIDNVSKWVFPLTFLIFCTVYWFVLYIHNKIDYDRDWDWTRLAVNDTTNM